LAAVALVAVIIAAIVIATAPSTTTIKLHNVIYRDVNTSASALKELVAENSK
jgi:hypothetical protein